LFILLQVLLEFQRWVEATVVTRQQNVPMFIATYCTAYLRYGVNVSACRYKALEASMSLLRVIASETAIDRIHSLMHRTTSLERMDGYI